jgi:8-oxo-dGTP pyrophosphatase MutT (NUDIX family)
MPWRVLGVERLHEGDVVCLDRAEVELNDGTRVDGHYIVRVRIRVVSLVLRDAEGRYLLLRRHRFIVDRWCWDVPAGKIAEGEDAVEAARRAAIEETGWRASRVREIAAYHPNPGMSDQEFTVCVGEGAERVGGVNPNEAECVEWVPREEVLSRIQRGEIDGLSLTSLLLTLVSEPDGSPAGEGSHSRGREGND